MALYPTLYVNGSFNSKTKEYLQRYMKVNGWYYGYVDADFGTMSWQGVQRMCAYHGYYNRAIDGDPGGYTLAGFNKVMYYKFPSYGSMGQISYGNYYPFWHTTLTKCLQNGLNIIARYNTSTYPLVTHA